MAAALLVTATAPGPPVAAAGLVGVGCAWAYLIGAVIATRQTAGPQMMGRVMALFAVVLLGGTTIGGPLATALIAVAGPRAPFLAGAVAAAAGAAALAGRGRRPVSAGTPA